MTIIGKLMKPGSRPAPSQKMDGKVNVVLAGWNGWVKAFVNVFGRVAGAVRPASRRTGSIGEGSSDGSVGVVGQVRSRSRSLRDGIVVGRQLVAAFLAVLVSIVIVSGLSLTIASRRAFTGREIQRLQLDIDTNQRVNADLETELAGLLSSSALEARAVAGGFALVEGADIVYLVVPGYFPKQAVNLASEDLSLGRPVDDMPAEYSESLFMWIARQLEMGSLPLAGAQ